MNSALKHTLVAMATAALGFSVGCRGGSDEPAAEETSTGGEEATEASCGGEAGGEHSCGGEATGGDTSTESAGEASCGEGSCG